MTAKRLGIGASSAVLGAAATVVAQHFLGLWLGLLLILAVAGVFWVGVEFWYRDLEATVIEVWAHADALFRHGYERGRKAAAEEIVRAVQAVNRDCACSAGPYDDGYHRGGTSSQCTRLVGVGHQTWCSVTRPGAREVGEQVVRGDSRPGGDGTRDGGFGDVRTRTDGNGRPAGRLYGDETVPVFECVSGCPVAELEDAAKETYSLLVQLRQWETRADVHMERLRAVWKAVEWWDSGDWGEDDVREALAEYRGETSGEGVGNPVSTHIEPGELDIQPGGGA